MIWERALAESNRYNLRGTVAGNRFFCPVVKALVSKTFQKPKVAGLNPTNGVSFH